MLSCFEMVYRKYIPPPALAMWSIHLLIEWIDISFLYSPYKVSTILTINRIISSFIDFVISADCPVMFGIHLSSLCDTRSYFKLEQHEVTT